MRPLADAVGAARPFAPPAASWRRVAPEELTPAERRAWQVLAGDRPPWSVDAEEPGDAASARTLFVVEHAPGSQFEALRAALREGGPLPDDLASLALTGSGFRGQRSRTWAALPGNLHLCVLARLDRPAAPLQAALTALPAVATARAVERLSDGRVRPGVKWVNDLLVQGAKVAGVLSATQVQGERVTHALFGIGVNVACAPDLAADPRAPAPGCLADADPQLRDALPALTRAILREIDDCLALLRRGEADRVVAQYRQRALFLGRRVAIWDVADDRRTGAGPQAAGRVVALDDDLGLHLEGRPGVIRSGRMTLLAESPVADGEDGWP